ncbi:MAG: Fe-S protein assembly co-chaperone HscB [Myxococcota bacterium]|nr:Fe-S protein assembly co-chaperone HscB [Myxococcota bacterium]
MDPFATLGIPRAFDVNLEAAEKAHRELSRALHPDRFVGGAPSERRAALGRAVEANEAWRVVRDPILRAEALLALAGLRVAEGQEPKPEPEFLMEMLEQREALSAAKGARDLATVRKLAAVIEERARDVDRALSEGFRRGDVDPLFARLGELRFYKRFLDEVSAIEDELAI